MSAKKKGTDLTEERIENIESVISRSEAIIEKYQKQIIYGVIAIILIVGGVILYKNSYLKPQEEEALEQMAFAERMFEADSIQIALEGDGGDIIGFRAIIEDYGMTESANLANAYAGICLYKQGKYDEAISYLEDFDGGKSVNIQPVIIGLIGDAYVEVGNNEKALDYFQKAIDADNGFISPIFMKKKAIVLESNGDYKGAVEVYKAIKKDYPASTTAQDIEKYLVRAESMVK